MAPIGRRDVYRRAVAVAVAEALAHQKGDPLPVGREHGLVDVTQGRDVFQRNSMRHCSSRPIKRDARGIGLQLRRLDRTKSGWRSAPWQDKRKS
jgi:hypothetical protein